MCNTYKYRYSSKVSRKNFALHYTLGGAKPKSGVLQNPRFKVEPKLSLVKLHNLKMQGCDHYLPYTINE